MSRSLAVWAAVMALVPLSAAAQDAGTQRPDGSVEYDILADPVRAAAQECARDPGEDGEIVICGQRDETQEYLSPIPRPTQSDRRIIPGMTDPPCWVNGGRPPSCVRFGWVPPPVLMIDLDALPEPLTDEQAADIYRIPAEQDEASPGSGVAVGERVPIDLAQTPER